MARTMGKQVALGAALMGAGALAVGWWLRNAQGGIFGTPLPEGHPAPDLAPDAPAGSPVPDHFRPEGDAPVAAADRAALEPALARPDRQLADADAALSEAHPS